MEVPQTANAQAEAAISVNEDEDAGPPTGSVPNSNPVSMGSEEGDKQSVKHDHAHTKDDQASVVGETPIEQIPQVPFGSKLGQVDFSQDGFDTKAKVAGMLKCDASR